MNRLEQAQLLASGVHRNHVYGVLPFTHHLQNVADVLKRFGSTDEDLIIAAWLHSVIELGDIRTAYLDDNFGEAVTNYVYALTPPSYYQARHQRVERTCTNARIAGPMAIRLKLADSIAHIEHGDFIERTKEEFPTYYKFLHEPENNQDMWAHIKKLVNYKEEKAEEKKEEEQKA